METEGGKASATRFEGRQEGRGGRRGGGWRVEAAVRASNRKHIQKSLNECTSSAMCECVVWERDRGSNGTDLSLRMCSWGERVMRLSRVRCTGFVRQREFEKGGFLCNWHPMLETPSVRAHTHTHTHTHTHPKLWIRVWRSKTTLIHSVFVRLTYRLTS